MVNGEWLMNFNININNLLYISIVYSIGKRYRNQVFKNLVS